MEYDSLDLQVVEEDYEMRSQSSHSFTDGTNYYCEHPFSHKKELKMLDRTYVRQNFDSIIEKSCNKLLKVIHVSRGCG